ncbi:MAG: Inner membrane protein alx [Syntrophaceae bacterium PtaU1.Bin231]|nr:MAG: Inner membrane protein alx [Syntrophaceae bacterium PtaU1.Bin231]HOG17660.1 TerC family protein [Syntrophales bacterium]
MSERILPWILFNAFVLLMLALDLGVFHRKAHVIRIKEAVVWSIVWTVLALLFALFVYFYRGRDAALEYLAGYLIERTLSMDNLFVFLLVFSYFAVPPAYEYKVLYWGILGALIMRAFFIAAGVALIQHFHWIIYVFGAFLVLTGVRMVVEKDTEIHPEKNPVLKLLRRVMPVTASYEGGSFFVKQAGRLQATPLFVVLLVVETTDIVFAVDSIPAVFSVTLDPFIAYTSNVFAILGLRALYFALAGMMRLCQSLHYGLSVVLVFLGAKMIASAFYKVPIGIALGLIAAILATSIAFCMLSSRKDDSA